MKASWLYGLLACRKGAAMFLPIIGLEVGLLNCYLSWTACTLHGVHPSLTSYAIQLTAAHAVYATDRLEDYLASSPREEDEKSQFISTHQEQILITSSAATLATTASFMAQDEAVLIFPFLMCVYQYREFKRAFPLLKPFAVAACIAVVAVWMPARANEGDWSIVQDYRAWLPVFLELYASSNVLDIEDMTEDEANGVMSAPVVFGSTRAAGASLAAAVMALVIHGLDGRTILCFRDVMFQLQGVAAGVVPAFKKTKK